MKRNEMIELTRTVTIAADNGGDGGGGDGKRVGGVVMVIDQSKKHNKEIPRYALSLCKMHLHQLLFIYMYLYINWIG